MWLYEIFITSIWTFFLKYIQLEIIKIKKYWQQTKQKTELAPKEFVDSKSSDVCDGKISGSDGKATYTE